MQLSKNFTLNELIKSNTAKSRGIDNTPTDETQLANLKQLTEKVLQPIRDHFGPTTINSGYRSPVLNEAVRGSKTSQHCYGQAADVEVRGVANYDLAKWIEDNLDYDQLILEFYTPGILDSGWVHVSYTGKNHRKQSLTATKVNGKTQYSVGLQK
jgi:zinc D-Ala-D-Ala carboxypeptidase